MDVLDRLAAFARRDNNGTNVLFGTVDYRGLQLNLDFRFLDDNTLSFSVPSRDFRFNDGFNDGNERVFEGDSRKESLDAFIAYLKTSSVIVASTPSETGTDPIAGNPGSTQSMAAQRDFEQGFTQKVSQVWGCGASAANEQIMLAKAGFGCTAEVADANFKLPAVELAQLGGNQSDSPAAGLYDDYYDRINSLRGENKASIGIQYALVKTSRLNAIKLPPSQNQNLPSRTETSSSIITLPLSYTVVFDSNPQRKLIFSTPLSFVQSEGSTAYQAGLGVGYSHPLSNSWSLTPSVGMNLVASKDMALASAILSYSLTSSYTFELAEWGFNIGNMLGSYSSQKLKIGDYESDPGISNTIMTNGLLVSGPGSLLANDLVLEYFVNDTRFMGDDLFTDNSQEIGINIGKIRSRGEVVTSYLKGGISYMKASGDNDHEADVLRLSLVYKY